MKLYWHKISILPIFLVLPLFLCAQAMEDLPNENVKVWTGIFVNKKITKDLSLCAKISYHTNSLLYSARFSDLGLKYNLKYNFKIAGFYRFVRFFEIEQQRLYFELSHKKSVLNNRLIFKSRVRWERKYNTTDDYLEMHIRPKILIEYVNPVLGSLGFRPYCSSETFFCYRPDFVINRYRADIGVNYGITNASDLRLFIRHQKERHVEKNEIARQTTFNLGYRFYM